MILVGDRFVDPVGDSWYRVARGPYRTEGFSACLGSGTASQTFDLKVTDASDLPANGIYLLRNQSVVDTPPFIYAWPIVLLDGESLIIRLDPTLVHVVFRDGGA